MNETVKQTPLIIVRQLTVGYADEPVLENLSFEVHTGEVLAILGSSGCGKSTLMRAMIGLLAPSHGTVTIEGEQVVPVHEGGSIGVLRKLGVLFQGGALFSSMTVAENVAVPLRLHTKFPDSTIERLVLRKLSSVGLEGFEAHLPSEISGGMRKRAALARAMALDPKVLFFDEPSAGLDPITSAQLDRLILDLNRTLGTTVIIVTHEIDSVLAVASRVIMLDPRSRNIIAQGSPRELMEHSSDSRVTDFFGRRAGLTSRESRRGERSHD
ncbi:MAG: ATP-binding cassette domain-containing protein [Thermodesulfobacteriota bacterium]